MSDTNQNLLSALMCCSKDRGKMAALRRYWSPTTRHQAYPVLAQLHALGAEVHGDMILSALFATNPNHQPNMGPLGKSLLKLCGGGDAAMDRHVRRLISLDELDAVADELCRLNLRFKSSGIPVDYEQLLWDLRRWKKESELVKIKWARSFWGNVTSEEYL